MNDEELRSAVDAVWSRIGDGERLPPLKRAAVEHGFRKLREAREQAGGPVVDERPPPPVRVARAPAFEPTVLVGGDDDLLNVYDAAEVLGVSDDRLHYLRRRGGGPRFVERKGPFRYMYKRSDLIAFKGAL